MEHYKAAILVILAFAIVHANDYLRDHYPYGQLRDHDKCRTHHVDRTMYPYKFGHTNLTCLVNNNGWSSRSISSRSKRAPAPKVPLTFRRILAHSFVYYRGYYIEYFGPNADSDSDEKFVETDPQPEGRDCNATIVDDVAGYGVLSIDCIKRCAQQFVDERNYNLIFNNCHHFANYISNILCHENECPC